MNDTSTPPNDSGSGPTEGVPPNSGPTAGADDTGHTAPRATPTASERFFAWMRGLGISRGQERWFAGVAGGIAAKAGLDPLIVRGIFVVLALLGGPGVLLYLAGWLLLPDTTGRIHAEELFRGRASAGTIATAVVLGVIFAIPAIIWGFRAVFAGPWAWSTWDFMPDWIQVTFGVIWWAVILPALVVWAIVWFNRSGGQASQQADDFVDETARRVGEWGESAGQKAEEWGQKVGQQTDEWERRSGEYAAAHRLGAVHVVVSLALALLAGGIGAAAALANGADTNTVTSIGLVAAVSVLALSSILAGIRGRDSGWVGFASLCGVLALLFAPFSTVLPQQTEFVPFGNSSLYSSSSGVDKGLASIAGNMTVDVEPLARGAEAARTEVWMAGGNVTVRLPETQPVRVTVSLMAGNIWNRQLAENEQRQGGILMSRVIESNTAGATDDEIIEIGVRLLGGNIYLEPRGAATDGDRASQEQKINELRKQLDELERAQ